MVLQRNKQKYESNFGNYEVAGVLYSHADILEIFGKKNSSRKNVLLIDLIGHEIGQGKEFKEFLRNNILLKGWGVYETPEKELSNLSRLISDYSWDLCSVYVQLEPDKFLLANAGLPYPLKITTQGKIKEINSFGNIKSYQSMSHSPCYKDILNKGDFLFLRTDGIDDGFDNALGLEKCLALNKKEMFVKQKEIINKRRNIIYNFLIKNLNRTASEIVENFVGTFGKYFIPKNERDDDTSLVIIKKVK